MDSDEFAGQLEKLHERVIRLQDLLADLAEEVATGGTQHIRTASQNKALAVLQELRPAPVADTAPIPVGELCLKPQQKDNDDSDVCLLRKDHKAGHSYGPRPA